MSRPAGRVLHKSIDITRSAHNLTPARKTSPNRAVSRSKGHTNSFTSGSSSQSSLSKLPPKSRQSPYSQAPQFPLRLPRDGVRVRAASPLIKKNSSDLSISQRQTENAYASDRTEPHTDGNLLRARTLVTSTSIPANLGQDGTSPREKFIKGLEEKLNERLREVQGTVGERTVCGEVFAEVIESDKAFGPVLAKIKTAYDLALSAPIDIEKLSEGVAELEQSLQQEKEERRFALKKLEKLSLENLELSRSLDTRESDCIELQEKLYQISQVDMKEMPSDEQSWQFLISENRSYQDLFGRMERDLGSFRKREKKLLKLLLAMKKRGYPVDEIYEEEFPHHKPKKPSELQISETIDESETEPITDGPAKAVSRPTAVPPLRLCDIEPDSDSDSSPSSSSNASSMHLNASKKKPQEGQPNPHSLGTKSSVDSCKMRSVPAA